MDTDDNSLSLVPMLSYTDVQQHNTPEDCWIIVHQKVYDVSAFLADHPGGSKSIPR